MPQMTYVAASLTLTGYPVGAYKQHFPCKQDMQVVK